MKTPETLRTFSKVNRKSRASTDGGGRDRINLIRSAFASLLNSFFYPTPDDSGDRHLPFGPYGPGGPISRLLWAALNPQPLSPGLGDPYSKLAWVALNPQALPPEPDPYRAALAARG